MHWQMFATGASRCTLSVIMGAREPAVEFIGLDQTYASMRHEALAMQVPAAVCRSSSRPYRGLPEVEYPFHDRDILVTACGRICMHRKKINLSTVMAGQRLSIKEADDAIWLVSFMQCDPGYIDLEPRTLQTIDNPFGTRLSPMSQVQSVTHGSGLDI